MFSNLLSRLPRLLRRRSKTLELRHFRRREIFRPDYQTVAASLLRRLDFATVLDVGCANGFLLADFKAAGKQVAGIDVSGAVRDVLPPDLIDEVIVGDFAWAQGDWDLVCCVEVAEHVEPHRSQELVNKLADVATGRIYFTAAPPGQTGRGHVNCRQHREWLEWFAATGWHVHVEETRGVRHDLASLSEATWLPGNSFVLAPRTQHL